MPKRPVYLDNSQLNRRLRRLSRLVVLLFVVMFLAATVVQLGASGTLAADSRNTRIRYAAQDVQRGPIIVGNKEIAFSQKLARGGYVRKYLDPLIYGPVTGYFSSIFGSRGLEASLNPELTGKADNQFLTQIQRILTGQVPSGASVTLTLDPNLQLAAYRALGNRKGAIVAIEPSTGKILAMVSSPGYDPNRMTSGAHDEIENYYQSLVNQSDDPLINKATDALQPPGSVFKIITLASALNSGKYTLDSPLPNDRELGFAGRTFKIHNDDGGACGAGNTTNLARALALSCNVTYAQIGEALGSQALEQTAKGFGFNSSVQIPLEVAKSVYPLTSDVAQLAQTAFGQWDVKATPLEAAMISAAIANGGRLMHPSLIQRIQNPDLSVVSSFSPKVLNQAVSPEIALQITRAMEGVVESGTAQSGRIEGVAVAGKTGTAEIDSNHYTLWFTGFAPAQKARVAVSVMLEEQRGYASQLAVPVAKKVIEAALAEGQN